MEQRPDMHVDRPVIGAFRVIAPNILEDVLDAGLAAEAAATAAARKAFLAEGERLKTAPTAEPTGATALSESLEALKTRKVSRPASRSGPFAIPTNGTPVTPSSASVSCAALSSAKRLAAFGSCLLASGCSFLASLRNALLISAALALRATPNIS